MKVTKDGIEILVSWLTAKRPWPILVISGGRVKLVVLILQNTQSPIDVIDVGNVKVFMGAT